MAKIHLRFLPIFAAAFSVTSALAADAVCKFVSDANTKIYSIPAHLFQTESAAGKSRTSELIYLNNKVYIQFRGKWTLSPTTQQKMREIRKDADAKLKMTCRAVHDEPLNGEAATLYSIQQQGEDTKSDSRIWISKSRGLPLKLEMDMDEQGGEKRHRTIHYEYANVQAPAGFR